MKKLEIIPQHVYTYGDGLPAYKSGEWPGSRSSHFHGSKLILKPVPRPQKPFKLGHLVHFPQRYSEEYKFIPCCKKLYPFPHEEVNKPQRRYLIPKNTEPKVYHRSISRRPHGQIDSDFILPLFQKKIRVNYDRDNNTKEWKLDKLMTRKQRIYSLFDQSNGMINRYPGNKNYKNVENSTDFFKEGGLIVGSSNKINYNKTTKRGEDNFYQTLDLRLKILNDDKIWKNKITKENLNMDKTYVKNLNNWEENTFEDIHQKKENKK